MNRLINLLLGLPPAIDYSREKTLSTEPPKSIVHERNIPAAFIYLILAAGIVLYMTIHEKDHQTLQSASVGCTAWFNTLAEFVSEAKILAACIRVVGFIIGFGLFWALPAFILIVALIRSFLEAFPRFKNDPIIPRG